MKLYDCEHLVKNLIKEDRNNPIIYEELQKLSFEFIKRKKIRCNDKKKEDISYTIAGDVFLRIIEGEDFDNFIGFLENNYKSYFKEYYKNNTYFDTNDITLGRLESKDRGIISAIDRVYLSEIYRVIDDVMKDCPYRKNTKEYNNLGLSLALSIIRRDPTNYHLQESDMNYLNILIKRFYSHIKMR